MSLLKIHQNKGLHKDAAAADVRSRIGFVGFGALENEPNLPSGCKIHHLFSLCAPFLGGLPRGLRKRIGEGRKQEGEKKCCRKRGEDELLNDSIIPVLCIYGVIFCIYLILGYVKKGKIFPGSSPVKEGERRIRVYH